jgi:Zn-dependent M28 family amino/carboxypeptidase
MKLLAMLLILLSACCLQAQEKDRTINAGSVLKTEQKLASDDMRGRATFTPDIERAADYIESRFKKAGLKTWNASDSYRQPFVMVNTTPVSAEAALDGNPLAETSIIPIVTDADLSIDENSGYEKVFIKAGANFRNEYSRYNREKKKLLVLVDPSFAADFARIGRVVRSQFKSARSNIFLLTATDPARYTIHVRQQIVERNLANIVGILPGKSKKEELVIFSAHYDHLGVGKPDEKGDSIFNGANDDASGTTAVLALADYFAKKKTNERTLVFATFTAEEIGEYGSQYFSGQFDPNAVVAMFNIEMIGTESKWGINSAYITGFERSDMGAILQKNLSGSSFSFHPDPYPTEQLFYRSDNATLARQGVPAHTISTSKMDSEKYYHTRGDEISTLDIKNMTRIIQAIALSSTSIVDGRDTPTRVDTSQIH